MQIPKSFGHMFWDCDPSSLDHHAHSSFVLGRLMTHTDEPVITWVRASYPAETLRTYLHAEGSRKLGPYELEYWCATLEVPELIRSRWIAAARARVCVAT